MLPNFPFYVIECVPEDICLPSKGKKKAKMLRRNLTKFPFNKMEDINFYLSFEFVAEISRMVNTALRCPHCHHFLSSIECNDKFINRRRNFR